MECRVNYCLFPCAADNGFCVRWSVLHTQVHGSRFPLPPRPLLGASAGVWTDVLGRGEIKVSFRVKNTASASLGRASNWRRKSNEGLLGLSMRRRSRHPGVVGGTLGTPGLGGAVNNPSPVVDITVMMARVSLMTQIPFYTIGGIHSGGGRGLRASFFRLEPWLRRVTANCNTIYCGQGRGCRGLERSQRRTAELGQNNWS